MNQIDLSMLLLSAERYALGRRTYIVKWTCETIERNIDKLLDRDKQVMIKDIENARDYGDICDKAQWLKLLDKLRVGDIE